MFFFGYGITACGGFLTTLLLAHYFRPATFGVIGLLFTLGAGNALLGSGLDTAAVRILATVDDAEASSRCLCVNAKRRFAFLLPTLLLTAALWHPSLLLVTVFALLAISQVLLAQRIILPIAAGSSRAFALNQAAWSATLVIPSALVVALHADLTVFLTILLGALSVFVTAQGSFWLPLAVARTHRQRPGGSPEETFVSLRLIGRATLIAGLLFTCYERLDPIYVAMVYPHATLGRYLAAMRIASALTLLSAGSQAAITSRLPLLRKDRAKQFFTSAHIAATALVILAAGGLLLTSTLVIPLLGHTYRGTPLLIVILATEYLILTFIVGELVALPLVASPRAIISQSVSLLVGKVVFLLVLGGVSIYWAAAASPLAGALGAVLAVWLVHRRRSRRSSPHPPATADRNLHTATASERSTGAPRSDTSRWYAFWAHQAVIRPAATLRKVLKLSYSLTPLRAARSSHSASAPSPLNRDRDRRSRRPPAQIPGVSDPLCRHGDRTGDRYACDNAQQARPGQQDHAATEPKATSGTVD